MPVCVGSQHHDGGEWGDLCPPRCVSYPERVLNLKLKLKRGSWAKEGFKLKLNA